MKMIMKVLFILAIPFVFIIDLVLLVVEIACLFDVGTDPHINFPCIRAMLRKIKGKSSSVVKDNHDMMETKRPLAEVKKSLTTQIGPCWLRVVIYLMVVVLLIWFFVAVFAG